MPHAGSTAQDKPGRLPGRICRAEVVKSVLDLIARLGKTVMLVDMLPWCHSGSSAELGFRSVCILYSQQHSRGYATGTFIARHILILSLVSSCLCPVPLHYDPYPDHTPPLMPHLVSARVKRYTA